VKYPAFIGGYMTILITEDGYIAEGKQPEVGKRYYLTDAESGTEAQNKAFHALVQEYFKSGCHSYTCSSWQELKDFIKRDMGAGFESFVYADESGMHEVKTKEEIPAGTPRTHIRGKLKSWGKYTKKERRETMDLLISTMIQVGVNSKKFNEILDGMEGLWQKKD
jgi:hypothetical protein